MPAKKKVGKKNKKTVKKTVKKKAAKKKRAQKNVARKKPVRKQTLRKKTVRKKIAAKKKTAKPAAKRKAAPSAKQASAGPGPSGIPAVQPISPSEEAVGVITHYYSHLGVAIVQVNKGELRTGDTIHIKGHTTDLTQTIESMEYEHQHVDAASAGMSVGIRVKDHAREHDIVYRER